MHTPQISITPFFPKTASDHEYERLTLFLNLLRKEHFPEDPPIPVVERIQNWKNLPDFQEVSAYLVWNTAHTAVIGYGETSIWHTGDNEHACEFAILVHPGHRCQGIGRQLLARAVEFARQKDRRLMFASSNTNSPAGERFLERLGAQRVVESRINQLKISDLSLEWVEKWVRSGEELSAQFEIGSWDGPIPEEHIVEMVAMLELLENDEPREQADWEDQKFTPETYRETEKNLFATGGRRWMLYLRDRLTGQFVGMTEVMWNPNRPAIVHQGETGVMPAYRRRGLGRWLKAAMAQKLLRDHPETQVIRTGNVNSNVPMLKINNEMGFKPYIAHAFWQVERERVEAYLTGGSQATKAGSILL